MIDKICSKNLTLTSLKKLVSYKSFKILLSLLSSISSFIFTEINNLIVSSEIRSFPDTSILFKVLEKAFTVKRIEIKKSSN